jgi:hypothetical protein
MFELEALAEWIQTRLNSGLNYYQSELLSTNRYEFAFRVYTDIGEHKGYDYINTKSGLVSDKPTNKIRRYIECQLSQIDSSVEATSFVNIIRNTQLEILIPLNDIELLDDRNQVVNEIRKIIDEDFSKNGSGTISENGTEYPFSFDYSLSNTGERNTRMFTGDSVTLTAYINFYYVEEGLSSKDVEVYIDDEQIVPIRMGIDRSLVQETNTFSNDTRLTARNTPTSSIFTLNFDLVAKQKGGIYREMYRHALTSQSTKFLTQKTNVAHHVRIVIHYGKESLSYVETNKLMNFDKISISTQLPLIASMSVVMSETKYIEGLTVISNMSKETLDKILAEQE